MVMILYIYIYNIFIQKDTRIEIKFYCVYIVHWTIKWGWLRAGIRFTSCKKNNKFIQSVKIYSLLLSSKYQITNTVIIKLIIRQLLIGKNYQKAKRIEWQHNRVLKGEKVISGILKHRSFISKWNHERKQRNLDFSRCERNHLYF